MTEEATSFLREIGALIQSRTVIGSELLLRSIAQTVRDQGHVTKGQREVVANVVKKA